MTSAERFCRLLSHRSAISQELVSSPRWLTVRRFFVLVVLYEAKGGDKAPVVAAARKAETMPGVRARLVEHELRSIHNLIHGPHVRRVFYELVAVGLVVRSQTARNGRPTYHPTARVKRSIAAFERKARRHTSTATPGRSVGTAGPPG